MEILFLSKLMAQRFMLQYVKYVKYFKKYEILKIWYFTCTYINDVFRDIRNITNTFLCNIYFLL